MSAVSLIISGAGTGPKIPFFSAKITFLLMQHSLQTCGPLHLQQVQAEMGTSLHQLGMTAVPAPKQCLFDRPYTQI